MNTLKVDLKAQLVVLSLVFCLVDNCLAQQKDSVTVFILGRSQKGEKYKVYYNGQMILRFKSARLYMYDFNIKKGSDWKYGTRINLYIVRKGRFGVIYRSIGLNPYYDGKSRYYILRRSDRLKNKYAFEYLWADETPELVD